jgi:hypothetical protein
MLPIHTNRIIGSTGLISSSTLWWISYQQRPAKAMIPYKQDPIQKQIKHTAPFSSESIDETIRRGGW